MLNNEQLACYWTSGGEIEFALLGLLDRNVAFVGHSVLNPRQFAWRDFLKRCSNHCVPPYFQAGCGEIMPVVRQYWTHVTWRVILILPQAG
jgi:hypothetical protein